MPLNEIEKSDIRRHLEYPAVAVNRWASGTPAEVRSYLINASLDNLEDRLFELDAVTEARLTGKCIGLVQVIGLDPNPGDTITVEFYSNQINGGSESVTITAAAGDKKYNLAMKLAAACLQNTDLVAAKFSFSGPFFGPSDSNKNILPQLSAKAPDEFTMVVSFSGQSGLSVEAQGQHLEPRAVVGKSLGIEVVRFGYIPILNHLEGAIAGVTQNADVARAGEYVRGFELQERQKLYKLFQGKLASFLGFHCGGGAGGSFMVV